MMNDNCLEYDCPVEFLLLHSKEPFHFCSKDTHMTFLTDSKAFQGIQGVLCTL